VELADALPWTASALLLDRRQHHFVDDMDNAVIGGDICIDDLGTIYGHASTGFRDSENPVPPPALIVLTCIALCGNMSDVNLRG